MFIVSQKNQNGFDKVILKDETSGTFAEIIPSCGAILHAFAVVKNEKEFNVIDSYESAEDFKSNVTTKGFKGCKLSPFVCRINKGEYNFGKKNYKITKYYDRKNALHGELYDKFFSVIDKREGDKSASVSIKYSYNKLDPGYPFQYDCVVTYILEIENKLTVKTEITNRDEALILVQDGWHPYFTLQSKVDDLQLEFQSKEMVEFDEALIPTGKLIPYTEFDSLKKFGDTTFDNCFTVNFAECQPMCVLRNAEEKIQVEIHPETSYPYLQFYTPDHRNSIAIENISGAPDAFNNGMGFKTLSPGETVIFQTSYTITLLT